MEDSGAQSFSNSNGLNTWWKFLWHLKIPPKVKISLWKACHHGLPVKVCLTERHILLDVVCPVCLKEPETMIHSLWGCKGLKVMRAVCGFTNDLPCEKGMHFQDFGYGGHDLADCCSLESLFFTKPIGP